MVQFANCFQSGFQDLVVLQPLLHLGFYFWPDAKLLGDPSGIANSQHPDGVPATLLAFGAALLMANRALKQRSAQDLGGVREALGQFVSAMKSLGSFHLY